MFILIISCLTMSNLPWFIGLMFQVPMQYCSLQHWIAFITGHIHNWALFPLWPSGFIISGSCLPLFPSSKLDTFSVGDLSFSVTSFCLFRQFLRYKWQVYWNGLPFPPMDHILSELSTMTLLSWVALHGMSHCFIELQKPPHHDKAVIHEEGTSG